jgi:hypothetical protein
MNPVARMIKQHVKTPLRYALPLLLIAAIVLVSASGCISRSSVLSSPTATPTAAPIGTASNSKISVTAYNQGVYVSDNQFIQPKTGNKYVQIYATVTNVNYPGETIGNQYFFKLFDSKNEGHNPTTASFGEGGLQSIDNSNPGQKTSGKLIFETSQSANPAYLTYNDYENDLKITLGNATPTTPIPTTPIPTTPIPTTPIPTTPIPTTPIPTTPISLPTQASVSGPTSVVKGQPATFMAILYSVNEHKNVCGAVNYYIDNSAAGGTWNINPAGSCSASSGSLALAGPDTAKLSIGTHTLKVDFLGNNAYGPSQSVMTFTVRS